jgi:hypothetical protein
MKLKIVTISMAIEEQYAATLEFSLIDIAKDEGDAICCISSDIRDVTPEEEKLIEKLIDN